MHRREEGRREDCVKVALRCRPGLCGKQITFPSVSRITFQGRPFAFDHVFRPGCSQKRVYTRAVAGFIDRLFQGYHISVLAYGQTGSGKTYTMGLENCAREQAGIVPRSVEDIFGRIAGREDYRLGVSFVEVYNEDVRDLLAKGGSTSLAIREDPVKGICIPGLAEFPVTGVEETLDLVQEGLKSRETHCTSCNILSSRSHAIFILHLERSRSKNREAKPPKEESEEIDCRLYLVDLAGSERVKKSGSTGQRFAETVKINQSLLALGNVIGGLCDKRPHVPYRDSKLTRLLQDSLGGNSRTLLVACVSPIPEDAEETLNTLRYAESARRIRNQPVVNRASPSSSSIEILFLKKKVKELQTSLMRAKSLSIESTKRIRERSSSSFSVASDILAKDLQESVRQTGERCKSIMRGPHDYSALVSSLSLILEQTEKTVEVLKKFFNVNQYPEIKNNIKIIKDIQRDLQKLKEPVILSDSSKTSKNSNISLGDSSQKKDYPSKAKKIRKKPLQNAKVTKPKIESCESSTSKKTESKVEKSFECFPQSNPLTISQVSNEKFLESNKKVDVVESSSSKKSIYEINASSQSKINLLNAFKINKEHFKLSDAKSEVPTLLEELSSKSPMLNPPFETLVYHSVTQDLIRSECRCSTDILARRSTRSGEEMNFDVTQVKDDLDDLFSEISEFLDKFKISESENSAKNDQAEDFEDLRTRFEALRTELNEKIAHVETYRGQVESFEHRQRSLSNWDVLHSLPYIKVSIYLLLASLIEMRSRYPSPEFRGCIQASSVSDSERRRDLMAVEEAGPGEHSSGSSTQEKNIDGIKHDLEERIKQQGEEIEKLKEITVDLVSELEKLRSRGRSEQEGSAESSDSIRRPKDLEEAHRNSSPLPHFYSNPGSLCYRSKEALQGEATHSQRSTPNFICQGEEQLFHLPKDSRQARCKRCNGMIVRPEATTEEEDEETITSSFQETATSGYSERYSSTSDFTENSADSGRHHGSPGSSDHTFTTVITCGHDGQSMMWTKRDVKSKACTIQ